MILADEGHRCTFNNTLVDGLKRLRLAHIFIHTLTAPGWITDNRCPIVVILAGSTHVHHVIDRRASTESFTSDDVVDFVFVVFLATC